MICLSNIKLYIYKKLNDMFIIINMLTITDRLNSSKLTVNLSIDN